MHIETNQIREKLSLPIGNVNNNFHSNQISNEAFRNEIYHLRRKLSLSIIEESNLSSSIMTIFALCNNIVGTMIMILPLLFFMYGIFSCFIIMIIIALITFTTANLCVIHLKDDENDLPQIVQRILGTKWTILFVVSNALLEILIGIVYFVLMNNLFYPIIVFFFECGDFHNYAEKHEISYTQFSFQISALILFIPCYLSCFIKNITFLVKIAQSGAFFLFLYVLFIVYIFVDNYLSNNISDNWEQLNYYSLDIDKLTGSLSLAFFVNSVVCPIIKTNENSEENTRDLFWSFVLSFIIYFMIGFFGYLGIIGRVTTDPQTIMDFFPKTGVLPFFINCIYFIKLASVYPLFCYISRTQFFSIIYRKGAEPKFISIFLFNTIYSGISLYLLIEKYNLTSIISTAGAIFGFFLTYIIPIKLHLKCFNEKRKENIIESPLTPYKPIYFKEKEYLDCNLHPDKSDYPKWARNIFYLIILLVGLYIFIIQMNFLFKFWS